MANVTVRLWYPLVSVLGLLAVSAPIAGTASAQGQPNYELAGIVAMRVWGIAEGNAQSQRACTPDEQDLQRRALFILNQTRIVATAGPISRMEAIERHPEYRRLKAAQVTADERWRDALGDVARRQAEDVRAVTLSALSPWENPPLMIISSLSIVAAPGVCAEIIRTEVSSSVVTTRLTGSSANTIGPVRLFSAGTLIAGAPSAIREQRGRAVEQHVRDFVNEWAQVNRGP